jgi:hypothetical protein
MSLPNWLLAGSSLLVFIRMCVAVFLDVCGICGLYLSFCASIIFGILAVFIPLPICTAIGAIYIGFGKDLAALFIKWLTGSQDAFIPI